jgi:hypothetical protein
MWQRLLGSAVCSRASPTTTATLIAFSCPTSKRAGQSKHYLGQWDASSPSPPLTARPPRACRDSSRWSRTLLRGAVRTDRRLDGGAPAGSSYSRLETFLFGGRGEPGAQVGTAEQFATAFAVLARAVGLPTRVMVGFRPGIRAADGTWVVRGRDAHAWPEVYFSGPGWVAFDPTQPGAGGGAGFDVREQAGPDPRTPSPTLGAPPISPAQAVPAPQGGSGSAPVTVLVAVGTVLLAVLLLRAARVSRRLRHRRAGPRGAWSELLDLLVLLGRPPARWRTATGIAADLAAAVPGAAPGVFRLAGYADRAAFAPPPVPATDAWAQLRQVRRAVRRAVPWYRRATWFLDPRPLRRHRGTAAVDRIVFQRRQRCGETDRR